MRFLAGKLVLVLQRSSLR